MTIPPIPEFEIYMIDQVVPNWSGPQPEGGRVLFSRHGSLLMIYYPEPSAREIAGANNDPLEVGLVPAGQHTLFLIYRCAGLTGCWADASFGYGLVDPEMRLRPEDRTAREGYPLLVMLIDGQSGILRAARAMSLSPAFSAELDRLTALQRDALPAFTPTRHDAERHAAYARWPHPDMMAQDATIIEQAGLPFP